MENNMEKQDYLNYYLSLDISTTNVGIALWNDDGEMVELKHLSLKVNRDINVEERDIIKCDLFESYFKKYKEYIKNEYNGQLIDIIVEAPLPNTKVNINTTALLLGFNGQTRYILYKIFDVIPKKISVHDSRRIFLPEFVIQKKDKEVLSFPKGWKSDEKKYYIWEKVSELEPLVMWERKRDGKPKDICFDMSDAYCVGKSYLNRENIIKKC